jgi:programmed cell death protein 4
MIGKGFERLFELVDELEKDVPAARECLATFLSRCVVDEVLPPSFLSDIVVCNLGGEVVDRAKRMLSREHGHAIIEKAWGPGDGRPVEELKSTVDLLMHEYLLSRDKDEANRCIRELHSDLFHHEIVKRGVIISMDKSEEDRLFMSELFEHLHAIETVSPQQFIKGFNRLYEILKDIELDIPNAPILLTAFKDRAVANGVLPVDFTPTH